METTSSFNFARTAKKMLIGYHDHCIYELTIIVGKVGREAVKKLNKTSPRKSGRYAKGWAFKQETGRLRTLGRVYGKDGTYQRAHLLEKPHRTRHGTSSPIVHIKPVEEWANDELENRVIEALEGDY